MKKVITGFLLIAVVLVSVPNFAQAANSDPGGFKGFLTGCCFGLRVGADYNDQGTGSREFFAWWLVGCCFGTRTQEDFAAGKDLHWRDICELIPYVNVIFRAWDAIDTANGKTRADLQKTYGASYY